MTMIRKFSKMRAAALAGAVVLAAATLWPAGGQADDHGDETSIWIAGSASRELAPDTTRITFSVSVLDEESATGALATGVEVLVDVRNRVAEADAEARIVTRTVTLRQETRWIEGESVPVGFRYVNSLTLTAAGTDSAGALLGALVEGGGDQVQIGGISFTSSEQAAVERQLLAEAVEDAQRTAGLIADMFGLGTPMAVQVQIGSLTARTFEAASEEEEEEAADAMAMTGDDSLPASGLTATTIAGPTTVQASVRVRFLMQRGG